MEFLEVTWSSLQGLSAKVPLGCKASHEVGSSRDIRSYCSGSWVLEIAKDRDSTNSLGAYSNVSLPRREKNLLILQVEFKG